MRPGPRIHYDDDLVLVIDNERVVYAGQQDDDPLKYEEWEFVTTTKEGKGHYEFDKYRKYNITDMPIKILN